MTKCQHHRKMSWGDHTACLACGQIILPEAEQEPEVEQEKRPYTRSKRPKLTGNGRLVLSLRKAGKTYEEIAKEIGFSISTVKAVETIALKAIGEIEYE